MAELRGLLARGEQWLCVHGGGVTGCPKKSRIIHQTSRTESNGGQQETSSVEEVGPASDLSDLWRSNRLGGFRLRRMKIPELRCRGLLRDASRECFCNVVVAWSRPEHVHNWRDTLEKVKLPKPRAWQRERFTNEDVPVPTQVCMRQPFSSGCPLPGVY